MKNEVDQMIRVQYFAMLREKAQVSEEMVPIQGSMTYADLYQSLAMKHQFPLALNEIQVAVNDEFADLNDFVAAGSKIVFIPPVAGG